MHMCCERPRVSVLMGVFYRKEDLAALETSIRSILSQTFTDFELLICDDGSHDAARRVLDTLSAEDGRIRLIREDNAPTDLAYKLNVCLSHARGDFIARMDDDDYSHPERFAKQLAFLEEHPEIDFVGCNVNLVRYREKVGVRVLPAYPEVRDFYFVQPFIHPALMLRKEALQMVNGYSEDPHCVLCEDYDLLLRLYAKGCKGANLQAFLLDYTVPATAQGNRKMSHRMNEAVTRWRRFRELGVLPGALPYVIKPVIVGLLPEKVLQAAKEARANGQ